MHMCHVVGMGWSFVVQGAHDQTLLAIVRRAVCAQPARAPPSDWSGVRSLLVRHTNLPFLLKLTVF